jgi:hypothetical protein
VHTLSVNLCETLAAVTLARRRRCLRRPRRTVGMERRMERRAATAWPLRGKGKAAPRGRCAPCETADEDRGVLRLSARLVGAGLEGTPGGRTRTSERTAGLVVRAGALSVGASCPRIPPYPRSPLSLVPAAAGTAGGRGRLPDGDAFKRAPVRRNARARHGEDGAARRCRAASAHRGW